MRQHGGPCLLQPRVLRTKRLGIIERVQHVQAPQIRATTGRPNATLALCQVKTVELRHLAGLTSDLSSYFTPSYTTSAATTLSSLLNTYTTTTPTANAYSQCVPALLSPLAP